MYIVYASVSCATVWYVFLHLLLINHNTEQSNELFRQIAFIWLMLKNT